MLTAAFSDVNTEPLPTMLAGSPFAPHCGPIVQCSCMMLYGFSSSQIRKQLPQLALESKLAEVNGSM